MLAFDVLSRSVIPVVGVILRVLKGAPAGLGCESHHVVDYAGPEGGDEEGVGHAQEGRGKDKRPAGVEAAGPEGDHQTQPSALSHVAVLLDNADQSSGIWATREGDEQAKNIKRSKAS